jgi:pSer/pThr/pTyr-binding forkhead associated (FHA) protein
MILSISIDGDSPYIVTIDQESVIIGRSSKASVQIQHECISRSHLQIRKNENGALFITDLGSSNGTFLNNEQIAPNEEIQWHSFFPISLGHKILINLVTESEEISQEELPKKDQAANHYQSTRRPQLKTEDATQVKKFSLPPKTNKKSPKSPYLFLAFLVLGLGYFLFQYDLNKDEKKSEGLLKESTKAPSELLKKITELASLKKCQTENEIKFCDFIKLNPEQFEGTLQQENILYIFVNFEYRLKNVLFDPSFSFADKKDQITYLMVFFIFGDLNRNFVQHLKLNEVIMVDTSSAPHKINQVLKLNHSDLFKISTTDIETIKAMVFKNDLGLFKNVIQPVIQIESIY